MCCSSSYKPVSRITGNGITTFQRTLVFAEDYSSNQLDGAKIQRILRIRELYMLKKMLQIFVKVIKYRLIAQFATKKQTGRPNVYPKTYFRTLALALFSFTKSRSM